MKILIDNGHGQSAPGKRSPDGRFLEFQFNRDIAAHVASKLTSLGLNAEIIVPELTDVPLCRTWQGKRHLGQHTRQCRRKRLKMDERARMELLHFQGRHRCRCTGHLPLRSSRQIFQRPQDPHRLLRRRPRLRRIVLYPPPHHLPSSTRRELLL